MIPMKTRFARGSTDSNRTVSSNGWRHWAIVITVFGITGTLAVLLSQFLLKGILHLEGNLWSGPWSYRAVYLVLMLPFYSVTLLVVGTLLGKHGYFKLRLLRMWGRLIPRFILRRIVGVAEQDWSRG